MSSKRRNLCITADAELRKAIAALRRQADPIPSASAIVRAAVLEKYQREAKPQENIDGHTVQAGNKRASGARAAAHS